MCPRKPRQEFTLRGFVFLMFISSLPCVSYVSCTTCKTLKAPISFQSLFLTCARNNYSFCTPGTEILHTVFSLPFFYFHYVISLIDANQSRWPELHWRPFPYHGSALLTELHRLTIIIKYYYDIQKSN